MQFAKNTGKISENKHTPNKGMRAADWSMHVLKRTWPLWMNW